VGADGERLAKRHGAVTVGDLRDLGRGPDWVVGWIGRSIGLTDVAEPATIAELGEHFGWERLPHASVEAPRTSAACAAGGATDRG
jgi:glutamyl-tRNA synthetase